jgi:hypothetical protein
MEIQSKIKQRLENPDPDMVRLKLESEETKKKNLLEAQEKIKAS